jgi:hypothetical protein
MTEPEGWPRSRRARGLLADQLPTDPVPRRVVDASGGSWKTRPPGSAAERARVRATAGDSGPDLALGEAIFEHLHTGESLPYAQAEDRHGPLRPVVLPPAADVRRLRDLAAAAGRRTLATLAAALREVERRTGGTDPGHRWTATPPPDPLTAGSWEHPQETALLYFIWHTETVTPDRTDAALLASATQIVTRWVTDPQLYIDCAWSLPAILAPLTAPRQPRRITEEDLLSGEASGITDEELNALSGDLSRIAEEDLAEDTRLQWWICQPLWARADAAQLIARVMTPPNDERPICDRRRSQPPGDPAPVGRPRGGQ